jgi:hypothetical protein
LQYFGKRFYAPLLQRWVSADPLTVHALGADLNVYAYVRGQALKLVDPLGLQESQKSPDGPQRMVITEAGGGSAYVPETAVSSCGGGRNYCDASGNVVANTSPEESRKQDAFTTNYEYATSRDAQETKKDHRKQRTEHELSRAAIEPVDLPLPGGAPGAVKNLGKKIFKVGPKVGSRASRAIPKPAARGSVGAMRNPYSGALVKVPKPDAAADALSKRVGGQSSVKFSADPKGREFDVVSDKYVGQTTTRTTVSQSWREEAKATFEAAELSGRTPYFHFQNKPSRDMMSALNRYADRYGVKPMIDVNPL